MRRMIFIAMAVLAGVSCQIHAQIIHVPANQPTIQAGINIAADGDTVLVADGTYPENINFMGKAITVASHFLMDGDTGHINYTIIDGSQPPNPDNGSVVTFKTGEDTTSVILGFTITGGSGAVASIYGARVGGGIICHESSAKIIHNKIIDNEITFQGYAWGGGIARIGNTNDNWTVIENNIISGNNCNSVSSTASGGGIEIWGNARIISNTVSDNHCFSEEGPGMGGGVLVSSKNFPETWLYFYRNDVQNNSVEVDSAALGGGLWVDASHCVISGNSFNFNQLSGNHASGGGLFIYQVFSLELKDNQITHNTISLSGNNNWYGAGCYLAVPEGQVIVSSNEFSFNTGAPEGYGRGGGMDLFNGLDQEITIDANIFRQNSCFRGGGFYEEGSYNLRITNNLFIQNAATGNGQGRAGALVINNMAATEGQNRIERAENTLIINNTFVLNSADERGGALRFNGSLSPPVIFNCIFWDNNAPLGQDIDNATAETITVSYSDLDTQMIYGSWVGEGNIYADPVFIDDSCHISPGPCLDAGIDSLEYPGRWYYAPDHDFEGTPRPFGAGIDIGADEWDGDGADDQLIQNLTLKIQTYPNPTAGIYNLQFTIYDLQRVTVKIYDIHGREVAVVLDKNLPAGEHLVRYDVSHLPDGIYLVRLTAGKEAAAGKMVKRRGT